MCNNYLSILVLLLAAALAPAASATTITDDGTGVPGVGRLPLANCSDTQSDQRESLHQDLAACLNATIGPSMDSLLGFLADINPSTTATVNAITTIGSTVVIGPLCQTCFVTSTPVSTVNTISTVPEPGTWALLGSGLIGLVGLACRRFLGSIITIRAT